MLINIEKMKIGEKMPILFSEMFNIPQEYSLSENEVEVNVKGVLKKESDYFSFTGNASTKIKSVCGLCLAPTEEVLEFEMDDKFSETLETLGEEEVYSIVSKQIDLSQSVLSGLLIEVPVRFTCSDNCKGLCPMCGIDLNRAKCDCTENIIDERFAKLKDIFKEV